jgi:uncharacterized membrane protein YhiD involved in acid resistance
MMMADLIPLFLAQTAGIGQEWQWMLAAMAVFTTLIAWVVKWFASFISKQLEQHAKQNTERETIFAEQMERRDALLNRHADVLEQHTKILCVFMLEQSHFSDITRKMAEETIKKIDRRKEPS